MVTNAGKVEGELALVVMCLVKDDNSGEVRSQAGLLGEEVSIRADANGLTPCLQSSLQALAGAKVLSREC